jgi:hypothetical protein
MYPFELYTRYTLTMPVGTISESGRLLIAALIRVQRIREGVWLEKNPENGFYGLNSLPDDWVWQWVLTGKGEYVGTFPKRVAKYYKTSQQLKCPPEFLTELGNIARAHTADNLSYQFEFVNEIDWEDGDYGDSGSCWWGQYADARETLTSNGGLAIRFYSDDDDGIGRAWIVPHNGLFYLFNGYGFTGDSTLIIARVMATHLGLSYKKVYLSNNDESYSTMYINSGAGYAIGSPDAIEPIVRHDFGFTIVGNHCESCGENIDDYSYTGADDNEYCESCFDERFSTCENCSETHWRDNLTYVEDEGDYCESCHSELFTSCDGCNRDYSDDDVTFVEGHGAYCESCRDKRFELCEECNEYKETGTLIDMNEGKRICNECRLKEE